MIKGLTEAFKSMLEEEEWMDKETTQLAIEKVDKMTTLVGYPEYILEDEKLDEQYKEVSSTLLFIICNYKLKFRRFIY